jgi:hypothetical protein
MVTVQSGSSGKEQPAGSGGLLLFKRQDAFRRARAGASESAGGPPFRRVAYPSLPLEPKK